jgi:hypothetical protein
MRDERQFGEYNTTTVPRVVAHIYAMIGDLPEVGDANLGGVCAGRAALPAHPVNPQAAARRQRRPDTTIASGSTQQTAASRTPVPSANIARAIGLNAVNTVEATTKKP